MGLSAYPDPAFEVDADPDPDAGVWKIEKIQAGKIVGFSKLQFTYK
jgi:hypothetical protein